LGEEGKGCSRVRKKWNRAKGEFASEGKGVWPWRGRGSLCGPGGLEFWEQRQNLGEGEIAFDSKGRLRRRLKNILWRVKSRQKRGSRKKELLAEKGEKQSARSIAGEGCGPKKREGDSFKLGGEGSLTGRGKKGDRFYFFLW